MTAAQTVHFVEHWFHEIHCTGVFTSPMRQHSLRHRQSYSSNDLRDGSVAETEPAQR